MPEANSRARWRDISGLACARSCHFNDLMPQPDRIRRKLKLSLRGASTRLGGGPAAY
ncbi:hypothetical protein KL86PLE_90262 [uncultured Pleomorphomonas sp.]|uniref:Uncharacterized protein n=1 Tax=uncultured Pleomorphomonas sp. TaxID=442121 RepID=A0A212LNQ0_9HYPH|nr:hypothetical protein KL86PLE_90262 [uncultured Pleomorphomonas sp.]